MKIELVKSYETDGTWFRVLVDGKKEIVRNKYEDAKASYDAIVAGAGLIGATEVLESTTIPDKEKESTASWDSI